MKLEILIGARLQLLHQIDMRPIYVDTRWVGVVVAVFAFVIFLILSYSHKVHKRTTMRMQTVQEGVQNPCA